MGVAMDISVTPSGLMGLGVENCPGADTPGYYLAVLWT